MGWPCSEDPESRVKWGKHLPAEGKSRGEQSHGVVEGLSQNYSGQKVEEAS